MRVPAAILVLALLSPTGCTLSTNQSRGLMYAGGAAVFMGGVIAVDGATCNEIAGAEQGCEEDKTDLIGGVSLMAIGVALGTLGYILRPKAGEATTTTTTATPTTATAQ